ncbi:MAG TPA: Pr6Pr family membrane protein [Jatrophihabitans sp.]
MLNHRAATRASQIWNLLIVLVVVVAVVVQLAMVIQGKHVLTDPNGKLPNVAERILRFFSYFTIQSNILCAITAATLIVDPQRDGRIWRVIRLDAIVGITITGIIYATLLAPIVNLHGVAALTNTAFHYVVPIITLLGWLVFGPHDLIDTETLLPSMIWPLLYMVYTVIHGEISNWYPYPFVDVSKLGYQITLRNALGIMVLLLGVSVLFMLLDRRFARRSGADLVH